MPFKAIGNGHIVEPTINLRSLRCTYTEKDIDYLVPARQDMRLEQPKLSIVMILFFVVTLRNLGHAAYKHQDHICTRDSD